LGGSRGGEAEIVSRAQFEPTPVSVWPTQNDAGPAPAQRQEEASMPTFVFSYRSPKGYAPTEQTIARWRAWFDGMGDALVDMGRPVVDSVGIGECGPETTRLGGYSLVQAEDLEGALTLAKGCPAIDRRGGVEVGVLGEVPDPS
jgi:hypothetical protein